jgi:hypothetical protein
MRVSHSKQHNQQPEKDTNQSKPPNTKVQDRLGPHISKRQSQSHSKILTLLLGCHKKLLVGHMGWGEAVQP